MTFMDEARSRVRGRGLRIVYPEGLEERALRAAALLRDQDLARPILVGPAPAMAARARELGVPLAGIEVRDPGRRPAARAPSRAPTTSCGGTRASPQEQARERAALPALLRGADGAGGGGGRLRLRPGQRTKPFVPAFEIVRLRDGFKRASSVFIMVWPDRVLFYADCSVNIAPDAATLAEIGRATAATARSFGIEPRVAFLSFSTRGSAEHARCRAGPAGGGAVPRGGARAEDGRRASVRRRLRARGGGEEVPRQPSAGQANVFVFPDLDAGNIAYKITERLAGAAAIGPILQGLRRPSTTSRAGARSRTWPTSG